MVVESRYRHARSAVALAGAICLSIQAAAIASSGPPSVLNPKNYASPSGRYLLFVNPSDLYGGGKADYGLTLEGREVWSAKKPYTLYDARVGDDGLVVGYAYSNGLPRRVAGGFKAGYGDFRVVIIDALGKERLDQATEREDGDIHGPPDPTGADLFVDVESDRMAVRVRDPELACAECWWVYRLSTGKALEKSRVKELVATPVRPVRFLVEVKQVKGTPLYLVHWWLPDSRREGKRGARFAILTQDGKLVWSLDLPADYESAGDRDSDERLTDSLRRSGGILGINPDGRFELRFVKNAQRVAFAVARAASGEWSVSEVGRRPFVETATSAQLPPAIPLLSVRPAGRLVLENPASAPVPEVGGLGQFDFDARGRIAFLGRTGTDPLSFVVVDQAGKILHRIPLDASREENGPGWYNFTCVGADRYFLFRSDPNHQDALQGALVDVSSGKITPIADFTKPALSKVAGFADGCVVVKDGLTVSPNGAVSCEGLRFFDSRGKLVWSVPGHGDSNNPAALFSPQGVTVTTDGMIAVVDVIRKLVQFFDRAGKHHHTVDLKKAWGREPTYPAGISADRAGGVLVQDFQGDPPIVRMNADGTVRAQVRPRLKNNAAIDVCDAHVAPDGVLWVSDRHALYRLTESGVVDSVLVETPEVQRLDQAAAVALDGKGSIYAAAERTGAVHVFRPDGRWLRVCVPEVGDVPGPLFLPDLTIAESGDVYLGLGWAGGQRYLHFAPDGRRIGLETARLDRISPRRYAQPGTDRRWVLAYHNLYLMAGDGTMVRTITRRADGFWLARPENASVAADGSIAVVSSVDTGMDGDGKHAVSLYSPRGEPIHSFELPQTVQLSFPLAAYDGKRLVVTVQKEILLFDAKGNAIGRFTPSEKVEGGQAPLLARDGRELLLFDGKKTLHRFELP